MGVIALKLVTGIYDEYDQLLLLATLTKDNPLMGAIFLLGVVSGLRISDLLAIKLGQVAQAFEVVEKKTGKRKRIEMCDGTWEYISEFAELVRIYGRKEHEKLFATTRQTVHRYFKRVASDLGLDNIGTHSMRKTYAYNVLRVTKDVYCTRDALNHTNVTTTISYLTDGLKWLLNCAYGESTPRIKPSIQIELTNNMIDNDGADVLE